MKKGKRKRFSSLYY